MNANPDILTTSSNRNLFQPTKDNKSRRRSEIRDSIAKGKDRSSSSRSTSRGPAGAIESKLHHDLDSESDESDIERSQLIDLVVEDTQAEEAERVRARKDGEAVWNESENRHFVRTYDIGGTDADEGDVIREGYDPSDVKATHPPEHAVSEDEEEGSGSGSGSGSGKDAKYGSLLDEGGKNVWR